MNKTLSLILHIISAVLSVVLSVSLLASLLGTTLIGVGRAYLTSDEFNSQIDNTDLPSLTFIQKGEKITLKEYAHSFAEKYVEKYIEDNTKAPSFSLDDFAFSDFAYSLSNLFGDEISSITDYAVDQFLNSATIDAIIKNEIHSIIDYFICGDVNEARQRIENGITLETNEALNPENASTFEEEIGIEIKLFVFEYIENLTGITCDQIIILLSEDTVNLLKNISIGLAIGIIVINIRSIFNSLGYFGIMSLSFSGVIHLAQNKFEEYHVGKQDLVSYEFIKPLMDTYSPYADRALTCGLVLLGLFILTTVIVILLKNRATPLNGEVATR